MTSATQSGTKHESGQFARIRAEVGRVESDLRRRAADTVTRSVSDPADQRELLAMLGLEAPGQQPRTRTLAEVLPAYVRAVARLTGTASEGTSSEVTDTATAYLALTSRCVVHPGHDLMLTWSERQGWALSVETQPHELPRVLARLGAELAPAPARVAAFVAEVLRSGTAPADSHLPPSRDRDELARCMAGYETH
ncbi:hypothetical protein JOF53_007596 [Crossiella equi]|uniref:DUF6292 domain-containing protein n=1 Tax=Crossiella equi TaxID=130796 RepID=A0ABS5AQ78_9PSEU|nr:DUF6292 family protein [Crossiella equi]MBP2478724.1 hypothetical protein [Crossiella equi]